MTDEKKISELEQIILYAREDGTYNWEVKLKQCVKKQIETAKREVAQKILDEIVMELKPRSSAIIAGIKQKTLYSYDGQWIDNLIEELRQKYIGEKR